MRVSCVTTEPPRSVPVVLCGCENWSLILRGEQRLGEFLNKVGYLRHLFASNRVGITGEQRKLHNTELYGL